MMRKFLSLLVVAVMVFAIALPVCAEISPEFNYKVETEVVPVGGANVSYIYNEDGTVELLVVPNDGFDFVRWNILGDYDIISGTIYDTSLVVRPNGDINAEAILEGNTADTQKPDTQKPDTQKPDTQKPDTQKPGTQKPDSTTKPTEKPKPGTQSPSTGVIPAVFATVMAVSVAGIGISFKKGSNK